MVLAPRDDSDLKREGSLGDPGIVRVRIQSHRLARGRIDGFADVECPEQLGGDAPHISFSQVHPRANPAAGTVPVMV